MIHMRNILLTIGLFIITLSLFAFINEAKYAQKQTSSTIVSISLDTINPGPLTRKQLGAIKTLRISSSGADGKEINYKVISFSLVLASKSGSPIILNLEGNKIKNNLLATFGKAQPGDNLILGNLKIEGLDKFVPIVTSVWTFVEEKKQ
jgi:hypothetical protein